MTSTIFLNEAWLDIEIGSMSVSVKIRSVQSSPQRPVTSLNILALAGM